MNFAYRLPAHETIGTEAFHRFGLRDAALWGTAFVVVLAAQVVGAVALSNWRNTPEIPGAPPPAIMIELSEISVAPQVEDIAAEQGELALEQDAATPAEATPAEAVPEEVVEPVETEPVLDPIEPEVLETAEAVLPEPLPETVVEPVEAPPPEPLDPVELEAPLEPEVEPIEVPPEVEPLEEVIPDLIETEIAEVMVPLPRQLSTTLEEKRREFAEAEQRKKDVQEEKQREAKQKQQKRQKEEAAQKVQAASRQTAPQSVEAEASDKVAAKETASTTKKTPRVSPQKWQSQVIAHLNRMKKYPVGARKRREEGVPRLQFTIDRAGRVLSARIIRSSGFPALDQAALDMINRASPVPAPPDTIPDSRITLTVPRQLQPQVTAGPCRSSKDVAPSLHRRDPVRHRRRCRHRGLRHRRPSGRAGWPSRAGTNMLACWEFRTRPVDQAERIVPVSPADAAELVSAIAETSPAMLWMGDVNGKCAFLNAALRRFWGVNPARLADFDWSSTLHPDDVDMLAGPFAQAMAAHTSFVVQARYRRADGEYRTMRTEANPRFSADGRFLGMTGINIDITDQLAAEEHNKLLMGELNHRTKNILAVVQALARQTAQAESPDAFLKSFDERLKGLAASNDLLLRNDWSGVWLDELVRAQLSHIPDLLDSRIAISGPTLRIPAAGAQTLGMAFHELSTNSLKYGALGHPEGRVRVHWAVTEGHGWTIEWQEESPVALAPPAQLGFGQRVMVDMVAAAFNADVTVDYRPPGLRWRVAAPLLASRI